MQFRVLENFPRSTTIMFQIIFLVLLAISAETFGAAKKHPGVEKADIKNFPYVVSLLDDDLDQFLGMGVLVSNNVVFCEEVT